MVSLTLGAVVLALAYATLRQRKSSEASAKRKSYNASPSDEAD